MFLQVIFAAFKIQAIRDSLRTLTASTKASNNKTDAFLIAPLPLTTMFLKSFLKSANYSISIDPLLWSLLNICNQLGSWLHYPKEVIVNSTLHKILECTIFYYFRAQLYYYKSSVPPCGFWKSFNFCVKQINKMTKQS